MAKFIAFKTFHDESMYGESLPIAVMVKVDEALAARTISMLGMVRDGHIREVNLAVQPENVRWLSKIAFAADGQVGAVAGWFDPKTDHLMKDEVCLEAEFDEDYVVPGEVCLTFDNGEVLGAALTLQHTGASVMMGAQGELQGLTMGTFVIREDQFLPVLASFADSDDESMSAHKVTISVGGRVLATTSDEVRIEVVSDRMAEPAEDVSMLSVFTHEGVITDITRGGEVSGTQSEMYDDIVGRLDFGDDDSAVPGSDRG